ncbi:MAG: aconitate hydratase AcnA, partial [Nitrospinaceae bacterium]|nr:aconitate hydratase AcnA [Nitrospinaceae bacterium]
FDAKRSFDTADRPVSYYSLSTLEDAGLVDISKTPYSIRVLLENALRKADGGPATDDHVKLVASWRADAKPVSEFPYMPGRVVLQDFTGVPSVVDLAVMRDAMKELGGDPALINPLQPVDLVIDHSVQIDSFGTEEALEQNADLEFERNTERYSFLRWAQQAFDNFRVVPPSTGIIHQVNLEFLAHVVGEDEKNGVRRAFPDTLVGTDSHTTMINGLGVLGWGVGGIEAEAAMLGQSYSMLIPDVIGFKLSGKLPEGATATDLVLVVVQMLRQKGVVGKFVEFYGPGLVGLPLADRATLSNMAPEYGATCGIFPIDAETIKYLELSGRPAEKIALVEAYAKEQGMFHDENTPEAIYTDTIELDMGEVEPCISGPKRPQDRILLSEASKTFGSELDKMLTELSGGGTAVASAPVKVKTGSKSYELESGAVVIASITSCTNTSNPSVMLGAGLVAKKAAERGLKPKPWVKTSLAPGSKVVTEYLKKAGLDTYLDQLGFNTVGYGCTTCIGNSGPLPPEVSKAIAEGNLVACSVLSGNRNFEGRVHAEVRMNFLASPPLVVAYALAGHMGVDIATESLGQDKDGNDVYLKDIWPTQSELEEVVMNNVQADLFKKTYSDVFRGDLRWMGVPTPEGDLYTWEEMSTYVQKPPYFDGMKVEPEPVGDIKGARCLANLGDSTTTDHISPAGSIPKDGPAGRYLVMNDVLTKDFNSFGSRRGNHEVMMRGTFANVRLRNKVAPGTEGGWSTHFPSGEQMTMFDTAEKYREEGVSTVVLGGKEYGTGSSRDWAAKGSNLLGVKAVITESFERIHRSNLIGMGVIPLQFKPGESAESLGLTGQEVFDIEGINGGEAKEVQVTATPDGGGAPITFTAVSRIDTPNEVLYYQNGGILHYVLRKLLKENK